MPFPISDLVIWWSFGTKPLALTVSELFNVKCNAMVDVTLIRPLNKGQGHLFWYKSIFHIRLPIGSIVTFALGRTVFISHNTFRRPSDRQADRRQTATGQTDATL